MTAALLLLAVFFIVLARPLWLGTRDYVRRKRFEERCARIGYDTAHGRVELITDAVLSERRR